MDRYAMGAQWYQILNFCSGVRLPTTPYEAYLFSVTFSMRNVPGNNQRKMNQQPRPEVEPSVRRGIKPSPRIKYNNNQYRHKIKIGIQC